MDNRVRLFILLFLLCAALWLDAYMQYFHINREEVNSL